MAMSTTASSHSSPFHKLFLPVIFLLALLLSVIQFIITAVLIHDYEDHRYPSDSVRDRLRFLLFTSCWCLLFLPIYLFANARLIGQVFSSVASNLGFIFVTWLFWLCGAASWTDSLGGTLHCGDLFLNNQVLDISIPYCGSLRAVQAFSWMIWLLFSAALVYISAIAFRAKSRPSGLTGPMREVPAATSAA